MSLAQTGIIDSVLLLDRLANKKCKTAPYFLHIKQKKQAGTFAIPACCYSFFHPYCLQYGPVTPTSSNQHGEKPAWVNNFFQTIFAVVFSFNIRRQYIPGCLAKYFCINFLMCPCCLNSGRMLAS